MATDVELPITGGCGCGAVRFEIDAPLQSALYCHCTRCQHRSGTAAAASARPAPGSLRVVSGQERVRRWLPEGGLAKDFCGDCGSALFASDPESGEVMVTHDIGGPDFACKEIVFSVDTVEDKKPARSFYTATVCRDGAVWKWATAEPATARWGALQ